MAPSLLLRRQHQRPRRPARLPRRDPRHATRPASRPRCSSSTTPPPTARPTRSRVERGVRTARRAVAADRARAPPRQGRERRQPARARPAASSACCSTRTPSCAPGAAEALLEALERDPEAAVAGAQLLDPPATRSRAPGGCPASAPRSPRALFLHRLLVVQSGGAETREVGWVQSAAMLVRREAAPRSATSTPRSSSTPTRPTSASACTTPAGRSSTSRPRRAVHHEQLATDRAAGGRRVVEFHRGRDRYMRKHHGAAAASASRGLSAWSYAAAGAGGARPARPPPRWYWLHARAALHPGARRGAAGGGGGLQPALGRGRRGRRSA